MTHRRQVASSYREMLGSSSVDWPSNEIVGLGQLPGLEGILYGVTVGRAGEAHLFQAEAAPSGSCLDSSGIIDVFILKALRLFQRPISMRQYMTMQDELSFALDRDGRIAYIAVTCEPFSGYSLETQRGAHLHSWAERFGPSVNGR